MCQKDSISGDKLRGCHYCCKYNTAQHPRGGKFIRGGDSLFKKMPVKMRDPLLADYSSVYNAYGQSWRCWTISATKRAG
ncbi:hypothetical protein ACET3Z_026278 [Daucus carota]